MRIDKFIWTVRLAKTRTLASLLCNSGKVKLNEELTKASKSVKIDDEISIKVNPIWRTFKVLEITKSRIGAKMVVEFIRETTPEIDLTLITAIQLAKKQRNSQGLKGRPTKHERRKLDELNP